MVYYKLRQVLQSAMDLLQIATGITKCNDYYKLRQYKRRLTLLQYYLKNYNFACQSETIKLRNLKITVILMSHGHLLKEKK